MDKFEAKFQALFVNQLLVNKSRRNEELMSGALNRKS